MRPRVIRNVPMKKKSCRPIIKQKRNAKPNLKGLDVNTAKELVETMKGKERVSVQRKRSLHNIK